MNEQQIVVAYELLKRVSMDMLKDSSSSAIKDIMNQYQCDKDIATRLWLQDKYPVISAAVHAAVMLLEVGLNESN